jgi:hypothetical protein
MELHIRGVSKIYSNGVQALKPARAGIDPRHLLVDWEMEDNTASVKVKR